MYDLLRLQDSINYIFAPCFSVQQKQIARGPRLCIRLLTAVVESRQYRLTECVCHDYVQTCKSRQEHTLVR